jgi:hypothetical protein
MWKNDLKRIESLTWVIVFPDGDLSPITASIVWG